MARFYVTFTQPIHIWGVNLYSCMSVLESQRFWIEHWSTCQCLVNTYERLNTKYCGSQQVQNTNGNLNTLWHVNVKLLTANVWPRFAVIKKNVNLKLSINKLPTSGVTEVDGTLSHFLWWGPLGPWLNIRAKYVGNGAVNQDYYNTILFLVVTLGGLLGALSCLPNPT